MKKDIVSKDTSIIQAMKLMDLLKQKILFIADDENKFIGVISLGDIQRAIIKKVSLDTSIYQIMRKIITVAKTTQSDDEIRITMLEKRTEAMPVLDEKGKLVRIIYWDDFFGGRQINKKKKINLPVVIMAGGIGSRLKPLTNVIPKPLIPIGEKTIVEEIMSSFAQFGCVKFWLSVNYRSEMLKYYLNSQESVKKHQIKYLHESKPLGTAGSLRLLENEINETFFVTNCDILIDQDYSEILHYHRKNKNSMTIVAAIKSYSLPYGTIETGDNGLLEKITEKPEITIKINTGFYVLEPEIIKEIPKNRMFHITDLITALKKKNKKVGVFPVSEGSWKDIGEWPEYLKLINILK